MSVVWGGYFAVFRSCFALRARVTLPDLGSAGPPRSLAACLPRCTGPAQQRGHIGGPPQAAARRRCAASRGLSAGAARAAHHLVSAAAALHRDRCVGRLAAVGAFTTPQRAGEPAWHRRARRERGTARAWLRVAAASRLLHGHHSSQNHGRRGGYAMPNGGGGGKGAAGGGGKGGKGGGGGGKGGGTSNGGPAWDCHICGLPSNFGWRLRCRGCEAIRKGKGANGGLGPAASDVGQGGQQQRQPTLAERQLRQLREEQRKQRQADEEEKKQLREALARLRIETTNRKSRGAGEEEGDGEADDDELDGPTNAYSSWTEEERQRKLEEARGGLAYIISKFGEGSAEASSTRDEIESIQRA